jgi:trans-aconitate methyltransferase
VSDRIAETATPWDAKLYDAKHDFVWKFGAEVVSLLAPKTGERILDLGCGTGHLTAQIAESGAEVLGVDRSPEMVAAARKAYPNLKFEIADARYLPFVEEFDAVFSNAALHWVLEPELALEGIRRALRPGGRFVAEFGGKGNIRAMEEAFDRALMDLGVARAAEVRPWYFPSVGEYSTLVEKSGLEVRYAALFDRPTKLADGEKGLRNWITMFLGEYLSKVDSSKREEFFRRVEDNLRPKYFRNGQWWADYRRLRVIAFR